MSKDAQKKLRICLIGNSHSGCFKAGWDAIFSAYPAVEIKFYPHCGQYYDLFRVHKSEKMLSIDNDFIQNHFSKLSGNDGNIALDTFDLCVIVGGLHGWRYFDPGYSKQVIDAMVADYLDAAHVSVLLKKIREISDVPVNVLATPFGASRSANKGMHQDGLIKDSTLLSVALKQKYGARFLEQPQETRLRGHCPDRASGRRIRGLRVVDQRALHGRHRRRLRAGGSLAGVVEAAGLRLRNPG